MKERENGIILLVVVNYNAGHLLERCIMPGVMGLLDQP